MSGLTKVVPRIHVADVALDPRAGGADAVFTYRAEPSTTVGEARFVPVGNRPLLGFVVKVYEATEEELGFSFESLRPLGDAVDNLSIPSRVIDLAAFVAQEYLCPISIALSAASPPGVRERLVSAWSLLKSDRPSGDMDLFGQPQESGPGLTLTPAQREIVRTLRDLGGVWEETPNRRIPAPILKGLKMLQAKGVVRSSMRVQPFQERRKSRNYLCLTSDSVALETFITAQGRKRPAQVLTLMRLQGSEHASLSIPEIKAMAGVTETTITALVDAGLLLPVNPDEHPPGKAPKANRYQQLAIDAVVDSIRQGLAKEFLLFGVTGSGKTEVYLRLAAEALRAGRQVLYLVPEIALATQSIAQLRERFGRGVAIMHSELAPSERLQNWLQIREGAISIVLGARSALFAPLDNLGLIVVDEEHEASYKQESSPRYHARRLVQHLAKIHGCPVVLGSATPSIETFQEAEDEIVTLLSLPERAASANLPKVEIEDLSLGYRQGTPSIISGLLEEKLHRTLANKEQAILFLNRRAYAPFIICRDCGHQMLCPRCSVSLSFHRREAKLRCHHCDFQIRPPEICPACQGIRMKPFGVGTEKVEEAIAELFPDARCARLDRDIARKKGALEGILAAFRSGDLDILVGTQMVAKGLDFPNVTLVGVIAADISLNIPDFRSSERTFQLLSQVAGRAGRGSRPGEVVIQTFNPTHVAVLTAQTHDYPAFFESLRLERRQVEYPPFCRLVNVVVSGESREAVLQATAEMTNRIQAALTPEDRATLLGPTDCPLERLNGRWRRHLLVKLARDRSPSVIGNALKGLSQKGIQTIVDVDPYSLM
ncbi:MAG: primosomal protein N' [Fimbriimonadaceae bacterium]|nr:primosomal protein N' [Fimbriimonadaceae bacterium]